jgi:REP element-mobilizing transposase RayT
MSRAWRIEYEGALYHLLSRGNEGRDIFINDKDRVVFLDTIGEMSERFEIDVFAYVLMGNHYHLLARTKLANLKRAMHWFGTVYTQRFNRRHFRNGHLFQGRYKSIIVQNDAYLLQLSYYIHRNPLRAGIVKRLVDYRWSSYRFYAYGRKAPDWLSTALILSQFERNEDRHKSYREKVQKYAKEEKRLLEDLRHGLILGSKQFVEKIRRQYLPAKPDSSIPQQNQLTKGSNSSSFLNKVQRLLHKYDVQQFVEAGRLRGAEKDRRDLLLYMIWKSGQLSNERIGQLFGLSYSAVSHAVKSLEAHMKENPELKKKYNQLNSQFKL